MAVLPAADEELAHGLEREERARVQLDQLGRAPVCARHLRQVHAVPQHCVAVGGGGDGTPRAGDEARLGEAAHRLLEVALAQGRRVVRELPLVPRPEDGDARPVGDDRAHVARVEAHADLRLGRVVPPRGADLRGVERAVRLGGEVPDRDELRRVVLAQRDEVARVGREVHHPHTAGVGHRDGLDCRRSVAVPQHDHRVQPPIRRGDPSAILADARAADRVAVALQQLLRLAGQVVDDARVRGDVKDGAAVVVAQVVHRHVSAEAERPRQGEHVLRLLRRHGATTKTSFVPSFHPPP